MRSYLAAAIAIAGLACALPFVLWWLFS